MPILALIPDGIFSRLTAKKKKILIKTERMELGEITKLWGVEFDFPGLLWQVWHARVLGHLTGDQL